MGIGVPGSPPVRPEMPTITETPASLSPRFDSVEEMTGRWWVAQTRPQYEKKLARELASQGVGYFLPQVKLNRVLAGKKRVVTVPWFPMYVFVNGDEDARYIAACSTASTVIRNVTDQARLARELLNVQRHLPSEVVSPELQDLRVGMQCRVKAGHALEGSMGWIDEVSGKGRVVMAITILGQGVPTEIDPVYLEPA